MVTCFQFSPWCWIAAWTTSARRQVPGKDGLLPARAPLRTLRLPRPAARAVGNLLGGSWSRAVPESSREAAGSRQGKMATPRETLLSPLYSH